MKNISVVVVTFNSIKFITACLDSVFSQIGNDCEVIVVDNGSTDGSADLISKNYPRVILMVNPQNYGAARARNQGIEIANGEWILVLDCDTELKNNFFEEFGKLKGNLDSSIGIIQPKILNYDKKSIYSTGMFVSRLRRFYDIGKGRPDKGQFDEPGLIFAASSAAAFYKRGTLEKIREENGFFDQRFFFLLEDIDIAWRARNRGFKTLYHPKLSCYHCGNSSATGKKRRQYLCFRNRHLLITKNDKPGFPKLALFFVVYDLPRIIYLMFTNPFAFKALKEVKTFYQKSD